MIKKQQCKRCDEAYLYIHNALSVLRPLLNKTENGFIDWENNPTELMNVYNKVWEALHCVDEYKEQLEGAEQ